METAVQTENLTKRFRTRLKTPGLGQAVKGVFRPTYKTVDAVCQMSFEIASGDLVAFIGPNGAGKSTTIKLISGILHPDSGSVEVLGLNPHKARKALSRRIGTVFGQKSQLWYHLPPADSFRLLGAIYDLSDKVADDRVTELAEVFEIADLLSTPVRKLSLGQRIRCEIAASLLHRPEILFLDEPSIGLDVVVKQRIRDLIQRINQEQGVTIFLTSHDAGDIEKICRRAIVINHGAIVWDGSIKEMKYSFLNRRILDLKLDGPIDIEMPGVEIVKTKDYSAKLEVDLALTKIEAVISELMKRRSIVDITIASTPMEEVIAHIYAGKERAGDEPSGGPEERGGPGHA